jgi:hypothetical protein
MLQEADEFNHKFNQTKMLIEKNKKSDQNNQKLDLEAKTKKRKQFHSQLYSRNQ